MQQLVSSKTHRIKRENNLGTFALVLFCFLFGCAAPKRPALTGNQDYETVKEYLDSYIEYRMKEDKTVGLSIALVDDQEIIWAKGFGFSDKKADSKATEKTVYGVGSISKLFTATAAMQLAEKGELNIDEPINQYVPEIKINTRFLDASPITARSIMTHHSGMPTDIFNGNFRLENPPSLKKYVFQINDEFMSTPPGLLYSYSSFAFNVLGYMVEKITSTSFVSYTDKNILRPLEMTNSSFVKCSRLTNHLSKTYRNGMLHKEPLLMGETKDNPSGAPSGSLYSNVVDVGNFMKMVFADGSFSGNQILTKDSLSEMLTPQNNDVELDFDGRVGLGWFLDDDKAEHDGAREYYKSSLVILPKRKLGVVVLSNSPASVNNIAREALETLEIAKFGPQDSDNKQESKPKKQTSSINLEEHTGYYDTRMGVANITSKRGSLYAEIAGRRFKLVDEDNGRFRFKYLAMGFIPFTPPIFDGVEVSFKRAGERDVLVIHFSGKRYFWGMKLNATPMMKDWKGWIGTYRNRNSEVNFLFLKEATMYEKDGFLLADVVIATILGEEVTMTVALNPLSEHESVVMGLREMRGGTIRKVVEGGETKLKVSGCVMSKVGSD